jgi:hypothetical protein
MKAPATTPRWHVAAVLVGRLIFAGVFAMAATSKFADMNSTAGHIAAAGFPFSLLLAWLAAFFEAALVWTKRRTMMTRNRHVCALTRAEDSSAALRCA